VDARDYIVALALSLGLSAFASARLPVADAQPAASASRRLADAQALLQLKNAPAAATLLWDVVARGKDEDELTYREALYTLGEALYRQGELVTAQRVLTEVADLTPPSPKAPLALTRLLELALALSSSDRADEWVERLRRLPANEQPPTTNYLIGRYLLLGKNKRYLDARATLLQVPAENPYFLRARYLIGATLVALEKLPEAEAEFAAIVQKPLPSSDDDRRVVELSQLALGRIYAARAMLPGGSRELSDKAHDAYLRISQKSDLFREAIYEAAWVAIRTQAFERAEQSLQLLLLAYRDAHESSFAAIEAKMLLGNLLLRRDDADGALAWFLQAQLDAGKVVDALGEQLVRPDPEKLSALIAEYRRAPFGFDIAKLAPPEALPLLREDPEVASFLAMQKDLADLQRAVAEVDTTLSLLDRQVSQESLPQEKEELQQALLRERDNAQAYRQGLEQAERDTAQLGGALLAAAGQAVHKKFAEVQLRAEAGVLDVAWARKIGHSERVASLAREEKRDLRILEDEFGPPNDKSPPPQKSEPPPLPPGIPADVSEDLQRYFETAEMLQTTLAELGQKAYAHRRQTLVSEYAAKIHTEEAEERARRNQAIAQFEQFLSRYPNHPRFSPDAMFRLAELDFERSSEEFATLVKKQNDAGDTTGLPNYAPSVELYRRLLQGYPRYRFNDGVHYLLGYCLGEMGKEPESRQAFLGLVCSNKFRALDPPAPWPARKLKSNPYEGCQPQKGDSRFLAETWTRLGEQHFDRGEMDAAIAAYSQVLPFRDSPYFDKALYKLAWSYYRADRFPEAVQRFDELVVFADQKRAQKKEAIAKSEKGAASLRNEAVQYLALSFAERDWNGDGRTDSDAGIPRLESFYRDKGDKPHAREVLVRLGDIWFERTEFTRAAEAYQHAIAHDPMASDNPKLQERVVACYDRLRSFEQALRAREALARDYAKGSRWYEGNQGDPDALATATDLADASLLHAITNRHASAQELRQRALAGGKRDLKLLAQARDGYRQAAESYASYLKQHPQAKDAYEYSYLLAESLFYGGDYAAAAAAYARVRDADSKGAHLEEAAYGVVKAQEHVALAALRGDDAAKAAETDEDDVSQKLDEKLPPMPAVGKLAPPVSPLTSPQEVDDLQVAYERYVALLPKAERTALLAYKSAELDFRYQRFDRARQRFALVLDRYCHSDRAIDAGNAILVSHAIEGNLDQVESWTARIQQKGCGEKGALAAQQRDSLKKLSEDVSFKKAEQLLENKRYEAAASMFVALVEKNPHGPVADKALYNAAIAYENIKRYAGAAGLYERLARDYPQSQLADEALFRAAFNQQRLFLFDKALLAYRAIATLPRYARSPHRHDALYNAALLADRDGDLTVGVELWKLYENDPATPAAEINEAAYRIALLTDRAALRNGSPQTAIDEWQRFLRRALPHAQEGSDAKALEHSVEAHFRIGRAQEALHNPSDARDGYAKAAKLGQSLQPGSDAAEFAAHAAFILAERRISDLERLRIGGSGSELEQSISHFNSEVTVAIGDYEKVLGFHRATWTLAAYFRMGYVTELYAKALLAAPCPPEVRRLGEGACGMYRTKIEESVSQIEEKAVARYAVTLEQAGRLGVGNSWTREARSRLSAYRPDKYPLLHDEHIAQVLDADDSSATAISATASNAQARTLADAKAALSSQKYESAMVLAREVLAEDERQVPAILLLARAYYHRGKLDMAAALVGMAQQIDENNGEAYLLLGLLALARDEGEHLAATAAFKKATELDPSLGAAWHNLAAQYLHAKNYEQALPSAQRAAALVHGPASWDAECNLGSALRGLGRHGEAADVYRRLIERAPRYADGQFDLGILYLDAPPLGDLDALSQKRAALQYLLRYEELSGEKRDEVAEAYIKEARTAVEREERKQKRNKPGGSP
jgi:tetratricopeptide (TPR) repeat protein